jgi:hypothetical protein
MAIIYVSHTGSNTAPYDTKATAANSIVTAAAASLAGDTILIDHTHTGDNAITGDLTIDLPDQCRLISWDFANNAPKPMGVDAWIGHSSGTSRSVTIGSAPGVSAYVSGVTLRNAGSSQKHIMVGATRGTGASVVTLEDCYFWLGNTNTGSRITFGTITTGRYASVHITRCTLRFSNVSQYFLAQGYASFSDCILSADGTIPNVLIGNGTTTTNVMMAGCDWSDLGAKALTGVGAANTVTYTLADCKLDPATALIGAGNGSTNVMTTNCYPERPMVHASDLGVTQALKDDGSTIPVTTDAPQTWGDIGCVWMMTTSAAASLIAPYVSPWISIDVEAVNGVTPYVEILRNNSATAYTDHEVWAEWQYKASALTERVDTIVTRPAITASPSSLPAGAATWSHASATKWVGKLTVPAAIDIKRDGQLRVRICVGKASVSNLYVDPQIRV